MTGVAQKNRLTLAVLDGPDSVLPAVDALLGAGLGPDQVGLAASSVTLDRLEQISRQQRSRHVWFNRVLRELKPAAPGVEATPGPLLAFLAHHKVMRLPSPRRDDGIPEALEAAFLDHIREGRVVLGVSTTETLQQWGSVRILLRQAAGEVRTFEFMPGIRENPAQEG